MVEVANKQLLSKRSTHVLVFDGGEVVVVEKSSCHQRRAHECSLSMVERWWGWQTSGHHQKQANVCSFSMLDVANKQPSSKMSTQMLIFDGGVGGGK